MKSEEKSWIRQHEQGYETLVWSMTGDRKVQDAVVTELRKTRTKNVLIPGCGSLVDLQNCIASEEYVESVLCTDFNGVINIALENQNSFGANGKIRYEGQDTSCLGEKYSTGFDAVVIVNSILSSSDEDNQRMINSCIKALRAGGIFIAFFPDILCTLDIALQEDSFKRTSDINLATGNVYDRKQEMHQKFYTPLQLRAMLAKASLSDFKIELFFCDTDGFIEQGKSAYSINTPDVCVYEMFVTGMK